MTVPRYDVLAIGRSSIDLYAHQIGVPMTEVTSFDALRRRLSDEYQRRHAAAGAEVCAPHRRWRGSGRRLRARVPEREGIETRYIPRKPKHRTSAVILTIQPPDRFPLTLLSRRLRRSRADLRRRACGPRRGQRDRRRQRYRVDARAVERRPRCLPPTAARAAGREVFLDLDYRPDQWGSRADFAQTVQRLSARSSIVVGTEEEVTAAADDDDLARAIDLLLGPGRETLIVKRGADGATIFARGGAAGDSVVPDSGAERARRRRRVCEWVIWGLRRGLPLDRAVRMGNAVGAIVVTRHGCANFMPTEPEVEAFVAAKGGW